MYSSYSTPQIWGFRFYMSDVETELRQMYK